jgi:hypothetical protein
MWLQCGLQIELWNYWRRTVTEALDVLRILLERFFHQLGSAFPSALLSWSAWIVSLKLAAHASTTIHAVPVLLHQRISLLRHFIDTLKRSCATLPLRSWKSQLRSPRVHRLHLVIVERLELSCTVVSPSLQIILMLTSILWRSHRIMWKLIQRLVEVTQLRRLRWLKHSFWLLILIVLWNSSIRTLRPTVLRYRLVLNTLMSKGRNTNYWGAAACCCFIYSSVKRWWYLFRNDILYLT